MINNLKEFCMIEHNGIFYVFPSKGYYVIFHGLNQGDVKSIDISGHNRICVNDSAEDNVNVGGDWIDVGTKYIEAEELKVNCILTICDDENTGWVKMLLPGLQTVYVHISGLEAFVVTNVLN